MDGAEVAEVMSLIKERIRHYEKEWLPPLLILRWDELRPRRREEAIAAARLHSRERVGALIHDELERDAYDPPHYLPQSMPAELGAEEHLLQLEAEYWSREGDRDPRWLALLDEWRTAVQEAIESGRLPKGGGT